MRGENESLSSHLMIAEKKPPKYRIGPIKGMRSMRSELVRAVTFLAAHLGIKVDSDEIRRAESTVDGIRLSLAKPSSHALSAPWAFNGDLTITPGTIIYGTTIMPTMNGVRLDAGTPPTLADIGHTGTGTEYYYLRCAWGTTFTSGYLDLPLTLAQGDVIVERHTSVPTATNSVHYIHLATYVSGVLTANPVTKSPISVTLWDNGYDAAIMRVGNL